jgi:hypothetical protein
LERKLELVRKHREEYGLNRCLAALGVSKSTWHRHQRPKVSREDKELKAKVLKVVAHLIHARLGWGSGVREGYVDETTATELLRRAEEAARAGVVLDIREYVGTATSE